MLANPPYPSHGTHIPALIILASWMGRSLTSVLELGAGDCSTPWLARLTANCGATLETIEHLDAWRPKPLHPLHKVYPDESNLDSQRGYHRPLPAPWSFALVDNEAHLRAAMVNILREKWIAGIIVCHDTEDAHDECYGWKTHRALDGCDRVDITCPWYGIRTTIIGQSIPADLVADLVPLNSEIGPWGPGRIAQMHPEASALARADRAARYAIAAISAGEAALSYMETKRQHGDNL